MSEESKIEWQPVPLPAREPPRVPPPDQDPRNKPELGDEQNEREGRRGSMVINGEDDRFSNKIKGDDEM